jgi:hypothetical protein
MDVAALGGLGINSPRLPPSRAHASGYRLPGGIAVTMDRDGVERIHGNVDANIFVGIVPVGTVGHLAENFLPTWIKREIYSTYQFRYGLF